MEKTNYLFVNNILLEELLNYYLRNLKFIKYSKNKINKKIFLISNLKF
jgi:hypothetical protein